MGEIEQLVRRAKKRDPDAFTELMQLHEKDMYRTASAILAQDADIADAIQETILTCWEIISEILELKHPTLHDTLLKKQPCYKVVASRLIALIKKGGRTKSGGLRPCADRSGAEKVLMDMYEVLNLLFLGGTFLIALLAYIDSRINKRK